MIDASRQPFPHDVAAAPAGSTTGVGCPDILPADTMHELANLLMVVSGNLELLRRQPLDERGQRQLARAEWGMRQAAQLMHRI